MQCLWSARTGFRENPYTSFLKLCGSIRSDVGRRSFQRPLSILFARHVNSRPEPRAAVLPTTPSSFGPVPSPGTYSSGSWLFSWYHSNLPARGPRWRPRPGVPSQVTITRAGQQSRSLQTAPARPSRSLPWPDIPAAEISLARDTHSSSGFARSAATAIRIACARSARWDAFHIWHSLRWSMRHSYNDPHTLPFRNFEPIDFGCAVSSRLGGHALLHGLLRAGDGRLAGKVAEQMMADGVRIHSLTLEHILSSLCPPQRSRSRSPPPRNLPPDLLHTKAQHPDVQCAVTLLRGAYEHRWQRTHAMYDTVISVCLLQAEVLVASLLLALLLQDYHLHASRAQVSTEVALEHSGPTYWKGPTSSSQERRRSLGSWSQSLTLRIVRAIRPHIERGVKDPLFQESSEALSVLASTIDSHSLPPRRIAPLFELLSSYPQCTTRVWRSHPDGRDPRRGSAHDYFHGVLARLVKFLPTIRPTSFPPEPWRRAYYGFNKYGMDLAAYNSLLEHSLIRRRSPATAQCVVDHMLLGRIPPVIPDRRTYTIALRGCTLMRRNDLAEQIVSAMGGSNEAAGSICLPTPLAVDQSLPLQFHSLVRRIQQEHLVMPNAPAPVRFDPLLLVAYVLHLAKTGRAYQVKPLVDHYIPELNISLSSTEEWEELAGDRRLLKIRTNRKAQIERAISLGPVVLGAFIHALRLEGSTGFAERIWELMKAAEVASWKTAEPWMIPVHAYTSMMLLYADEARRIRHTPAHIPPGHRHVDYARGFGRLHILPKAARQAIAEAGGRRGIVGREMGLAAYRHLFLAPERLSRFFGEGPGGAQIIGDGSGEDAVSGNCEQTAKDAIGCKHRSLQTGSGLASDSRRQRVQRLTAPEPDARFFDAAMRLLAHDDSMDRRHIHANRSYWAQRLQRTWYSSRLPPGTAPSGAPETLESDARAIFHEDPISQRYPIGLIDHRRRQDIHERASESSFGISPRLWLLSGLLRNKTRGLPIARRLKSRHRRGNEGSCSR